MRIANQPVTITTRGAIFAAPRNSGGGVFELHLAADLSDLQENVTGLLRSQLNRSEPCGDRIFIQRATLVPAGPSSVLTTQFHYERWACAKIFGKRVSRKLVGGNGMIALRLTPVIEGGVTLRLAPQVVAVQAQGPLGDLLRSGTVGAMLRKRMNAALVSAMQKGTKLSVTLPPAAQGFVTIRNARFRDQGAGSLGLVLEGEIHVSPQQLQLLTQQLKQHNSSGY